MSKQIVQGSIILAEKKNRNDRLVAWEGWPLLVDNYCGLRVIEFEPGILLVAAAVVKSQYHYWLYCLHPVIGPITLDGVNQFGFHDNRARYEITLCE